MGEVGKVETSYAISECGQEKYIHTNGHLGRVVPASCQIEQFPEI